LNTDEFYSLALPELTAWMDQGGTILWSIALVSCVLWLLIFERYYFLLNQYPALRQRLQQAWLARTEHGSWYAHRIRIGLLSEAKLGLQRHLCLLQILPQILLLLGLLGTVSGMISVFEVLYLHANLRSLADGISQALLTTMAGLLTALPGLFCSADLLKRMHWEVQKLADLLTFT